jgi:N-methylhydantoinase A/oxoprolinase/acetone carboxylase beta subunit
VSRTRPPATLVGIDTGGTFTDLVAWVDGQVLVHKVPSTPHNPAEAVLRGLQELLGEARGFAVTYSSTVATNALLERRGARVALLTTAGFEDVIEIGRQNRPELYAPEPRRPEPLVPRAARIGVAERMLHTGRPLVPLRPQAIVAALRKLKQLQPESVAVCFLHAYANPQHERRIGRALARAGYPFVSLSHVLANEHREYERFSTTVINAYIQPVMAKHLDALQQALRKKDVRLRVLQSSGGATSVDVAASEAVRTCLSGPAGGVRGAWSVATSLGLQQVISFDMGGTSTDVSLLLGGVTTTSDWAIGGFPLKVPAVDVHTVGAGGGSLAYLDEGGLLKVGPQSAGADPGPACYGRGTEPTVTDANLVLGRLVPELFLGGRMQLFPERARAAIGSLARALRKTVEETAEGIVSVVNAGMERAIRTISVERGHDPRQCALVAFGGAAGQHACALADALGMDTVVVPALPGLLSAWGALFAPSERTAVYPVLERDPSYERLQALAARLVASVQEDLRRDGVANKRQHISVQLEVRYRGQSFELAVPLRPDYRAAFERAHRRWYGYADPGRSVEVVNIRAFGRERVRLPQRLSLSAFSRKPTLLQQKVYDRGRWYRVPVFPRDSFAVGEAIPGPALIVELSATTWLPPGWVVEREQRGHLVLRRRSLAKRA